MKTHVYTKWPTNRSTGFALPTVIITSVVLFAVLAAAVGVVASTATSLDTQYYEGLASDAAESGITMAESCLHQSGYRPTWSDAKPLTPATDCYGSTANGQPSTIVSGNNFQSTFSVPMPQISSNGSVTTTANGRVDLLRASTGQPWRTFTHASSQLNRYNDTPQIAGGAGWKDYGHNGYMLATNGTLYGWGDNSYGQLGDASVGSTATTPIVIQPPDNVTRIKRVFNSGQGATILCVIAATQSSGDQAYCRGSGQLGGATWQRFGLPGYLTAVDMVVQGYSNDTACVLASDQQAYCAGTSSNGSLGDAGTVDNTSVPMSAPTKFRLDEANPGPVTGSAASLTVRRIFTQDLFTCVIASDSQAYCAGINRYGQLGRSNFSTNVGVGSSVPGRVLIPGDPAVTDIRMPYHGADEGLFFQTQSGDVYMTGHNGYGTANDGAFTGSCAASSTVNCYSTPRKLTTGTFGAMISVGERGDDRHGICVISDEFNTNPRGLWCMGSNSYGQLGKACSDRASWGTSVPVTDSSGAAQQLNYQLNPEASYQMNSLTLLATSGDAYAAGDNTYGKLGTGAALGSCNSTFQRVQLPTGVHAVAIANADEYTTFILGDDGNVYAMGRNNNGQLGNGTFTDSNVPVLVNLPRQTLLY